MRIKSALYLAWLAASTGVAQLHSATYSPLQLPPSFSGDGVTLYPGLSPDHDPNDLEHLKPETFKQLYYSQEGHRPALHGSKHGSLEANFNRPTVVLDHSSHLRDIRCSSKHLKACFTPAAFEKVESEWHYTDFNLITFHVGCGDQTSGKRSFFHATQTAFEKATSCVVMAVTPIEESEALEGGEINWATYQNPAQRKRSPVKGHVRASPSHGHLSSLSGNPYNQTVANITRGKPVDLTRNATALKDFFSNPDIDTSNIHEPVPEDEDPDFVTYNGTFNRRSLHERHQRHQRALQQLERRGIKEFFQGLWNGITGFFESIGNFFKRAVGTIRAVADLVIEGAIIAAKVIAVPFGVPFDHTYHNDVKFDHYLVSEKGNRPPKIFGYTEGFNLASSGGIFSIQCAKCGIHGDFSVEGSLAFSINDGVTKGKVSLINHDPFTIDAQFGLTIEAQSDKSVQELSKQLGAFPLSPLTIPGIITLGPQASISVSFDLVLNGKADLLIGGTLSIDAGEAALSIVDKNENKLDGFTTKFTPVLKASGQVSTTAELGLPIALQVGLDILNGKFKKTVGLINKPSVYASATYSSGEGHKCDNGVELRAGVKNRLYVSALNQWDYDIRTDVLYEKGIACVTSDGFDTDAVEPDTSVFSQVSNKLGGDNVGSQTPTITDVASGLKEPQTNVGFRVIMDEDKTSILVSGEDGYIYLVKTAENYDVSSPWGTIDTNSQTVNLDVFGRIMSGRPDNGPWQYAQEIKVYEPSRVPSNEKAAGMAILKTDDKDYQTYGVIVNFQGGLDIWYPTFCKTNKGLRMYATVYLIDKDGNIRRNPGFRRRRLVGSLERLGVNWENCRSVRLTSSVSGA